MKIAVLIPCYNEEKTVGKVIKDFKKVLPEAEYYVYDNNSTDKTAEIAKNNGAIVVPEFKQGKGNVIRSMFRDIEADCYLMIDGDDTYPAENAKDIIKPVLEGRADMVIGDRLSTSYFTENKRPFHNFGNKIVRFLINFLFKSKVRDIMTGYRAFGYDFVKSFPIKSGGFEIETEMTIHALDKNFKLIEVPVDYRDRPEGSESKLNTVSDGLKVLKTIFNLYKDYYPFLFFGIISLTLALLSGALFLIVMADYIGTGLVPKMPTLIVSSGLGLASLVSFFTGIILDFLKKQYRDLYELRMIDIAAKRIK